MPHIVTIGYDEAPSFRRWLYVLAAESPDAEDPFAECACVAYECRGDFALLIGLYVPPIHRKTGVATALISAAILHWREHHPTVPLMLNALPFAQQEDGADITEQASWLVEWYERLGFKRCLTPFGNPHPYAMGFIA